MKSFPMVADEVDALQEEHFPACRPLKSDSCALLLRRKCKLGG